MWYSIVCSVWFRRHSAFGGAYILYSSTVQPLPSSLRAPGRKKICIELFRRAKAGTLVTSPKFFVMCQVPLTPHEHQKRNRDLVRKQETSTINIFIRLVHLWITFTSFPDLKNIRHVCARCM